MEPKKDNFESLAKLVGQAIELEHKSLEINSSMLQDMMARGERDINTLDRVADNLLSTMMGFTGAGETEYHQYLDYMETFAPEEARQRRDDLEYDLGYKTHVLYAAAMVCQKELEGHRSADGRPSFDVVMKEYVPKVFDFKKKVATFLFFAHYANGRTVDELMRMLRTVTEETDYVLAHVDEFDDLMDYPRDTYHPLRDDEWHLLRYIVDHNIDRCDTHRAQNGDLMARVFGKK